MRRLLTLGLATAALFTHTLLRAQSGTRYAYPVRDVPGLCAANFGEIRPGHFHAGVDIKTDGAEGKPLVAVADGWLSRAVIAPYGYGRALYLTLPDGTTAVYGHLQRFRDDLEAVLRDERYRRRANNLDLTFDAGRWPVKRGDVIGYSGNSGSSGGPTSISSCARPAAADASTSCAPESSVRRTTCRPASCASTGSTSTRCRASPCTAGPRATP